jgi:hypothetical protein
MKKIVLTVLVAFMCSQAGAAELTVFKRKYKYYLDPMRAEEILSGISLNPRFSKDAWLEKIGKKRNEQYKVLRGDSLWAISSKSLGDPWLWRKLWQENPDISNPHELSIGQLLSYFRPELEPEPIYIPVITLKPAGHGAATDLDSDAIAGRDVRNLLHLDFFVADESQILGEVTGAFTRAEGLNLTDELYLRMDEMETIKVGDKFTVIRYDREVRDTTQPSKPYLGRLVRAVADVVVLSVGEKLVKVEAEREFNEVRRGDKVVGFMKPIEMNAFFNPPEDMRVRVLGGENKELKMFIEGHIVILNKGFDDGVKDGQVFRGVRDKDPLTESEADVEPDQKGEITVVWTSKSASMGYVAKTKMPILIGDTLLANQLFPNPPPRPKREVQTLLLQ